MSKFVPLLARAVAGLTRPASADARARVYEQARSKLLEELSYRIPPLSDDDVTKERLELEECIRRVEVSALRHLLAEMRTCQIAPTIARPDREPVPGPLIPRWLQKRTG